MALSRLSTLLAIILLVVGAVILAVVTSLASNRVESQVKLEAAQSAGFHAALLASEIEHYQALPIALATDGEVQDALVQGDARAAIPLSRRFALISSRIGSAAIYLIGADGRTIAASNAATPASFVGRNYQFRQYFRDAMRTGRSNQFALGSTTRRPGLYIAQRVESEDRSLGVLVVKVEFLSLEADWQRSGTSAYVTDERGDIIITTDARWRFRKASTVLADDGNTVRMVTAGTSDRFMRGRADTLVSGWTVHALVPVDDRINDAVTAAAAMTVLSLASGGGLLLWLLQNRRRAQVKQLADELARRVLENRVDERTVELSRANELLLEEMNERRRAEESADILHEELEQANRLATLGQIAAGVTHEINQPVAAIRATADNAATMLDRGEIGSARAALGKITKLTERIGTIAGELRSFSAKRGGKARLISVDAAIDGALVLVGTGLRQAGVVLERSARNSDVKLLADRIRIEQILVNLLRNAIEALEGHPEPRIAIDVLASPEQVDIRIGDNGTGISDELGAVLFTPFRTTKPQGLGLGLVISRDIAASLGGELNLVPPDPDPKKPTLSGAIFQLLLPRAT